MRCAVAAHDLAVISADYRLAPQTRLPAIFQDVVDCIAFIRTSLAASRAHAIDASRLAVSGSSAGGYLALLAGLHVDPQPTCLLPIYPITDPLGQFFTTSQPPPSIRPRLASREELAACLDPHGEVVANCGPVGEDVRMGMYVRMMADASLPALLGIEGLDVEEKGRWRVSRNVLERGLPAMYVLHGDGDEAVGVEQADEVVGAALGCGVEVVYERVHGANHFLDVGETYENERMYAWLVEQLKES